MNGKFRNEEEREKKKMEIFKKSPYLAEAKVLDIYTGNNIVVLNKQEALSHEIYEGYRVEIEHKGKKRIVIVDLSDKLVKKGEIGIFKDTAKNLSIKQGSILEINNIPKPKSIEQIKRKIEGKTLKPKEIDYIIKDLMDNKLSESELSAFITASYIRGLNDDETVALTKAIVRSGSQLKLKEKHIADKHCIGGVAGNRTTMILVPIVAAAGIKIPKSSSRAITSASGTADTMEVLAKVDFGIDKLREIVEKTNGAIVWGGGMNLASADDKLIKIRRPLSLDPRGILLASILAKKKAVGAKEVVIDIPVGIGAKVESMDVAKDLAHDFLKIGKRLGMKIEVLLTDGYQPIGNGVGPALEARDVLRVLEGNGPSDLKEKGALLAGKLLEAVGKVKEGKGYETALFYLDSGKALKKMKQIIKAQQGKIFSSKDIEIGKYKYDVVAKRSGRISKINNKMINKIARAAGSPFDKRAGIYLHKRVGEYVEQGEPIFSIYADSKERLEFAISGLEVWDPIEMEKILIGTIKE